MDKLQMQYNIDYLSIEKKLQTFIDDYLRKYFRYPADNEIRLEAQLVFSQMENCKFNKVWFAEFLKKLPFRQKENQEEIFLEQKQIIDLSPKNETNKFEHLFN